MKKNYLKFICVVLLFCATGKTLIAQCTAPSPPAISGVTVAGCVSSSSFTLTATPTGTNPVGWYAYPYGGNALTTNSVFTTPTLTSGTVYYAGQSTYTSQTIDALAMPSYSRNVPAQETRGYYFTAPVDLIITGLRVPVAVGGTVSGIAVVKLPTAPPLYSSVTNTFSTLFLNQAITGTNIVAVNIPVYAGDIIGVLGERNDTSAYGPNYGNGMYTSTLGVSGPTVNLYRMGMLYNLATQTPTNLWSETVNSIGIIELYAKRTCNSTLTPVTVTVVPAPQVTIAPPPVVCANHAYTLSASGATSFTWTGGPQTPTYVINPSTTTTYSVQGSVGSGCTSTVSAVTVSVIATIPTMTISSSSSSICSGNTVTLNGGGSPSYTWAAGIYTITNNAPFSPTATQQYTLYGSNACGIGSAMVTVSVNPTPTLVTAVTPNTVCDGQTATLTVTGAATYSWSGAASSGSAFVVTPASSTAYNVTGTSSAGCPASAAQVVLVNPNPTVTAGVASSPVVCAGGPATLTSSGAETYSWNTGAQTSTTVVNPSATQVYTVSGTYTATQCSSTETVMVSVFIPTLSMTSNTSVCDGAVISLTADAGPGATYLWNTGSTFNNISLTATTTASYTLTATAGTINGVECNTMGSVLVTVFPDPTIHVTATRTLICKGEKQLLTASGGTAYAWTNQTPTTATLLVGPNVVNVTTTYTVTGTDVNGCQGVATIGVKVDACAGVNEFRKDEAVAVYPNPNSGNFTVRAKDAMKLSLTNELGQEIRQLNFSQENDFQQDVGGLSIGIYFIKGSVDGASVNAKIVVTK